MLSTPQLRSTTASGSTLQQASAVKTNGTSSRPHITLNPYSTQLVDNINMMMGQHQQQQTASKSNNAKDRPLPTTGDMEEVVYRAVSPHGHVYWEIDPASTQGYNMLVNNNRGNLTNGGSAKRFARNVSDGVFAPCHG